MRILSAVLLCLVAVATAVSAQEKPVSTPATPANPYTSYTKDVYDGVKGIILRSAEKMPEENFSFKPTPEVRSFGQILGHIADAQYLFCSKVTGETNPAPKIEQTKTSKADLITALKNAFAYCDKAYAGMTDASGTTTVKLFGGDTPKLGVLGVNNLHTVEHYGNLVTYMRLKNIVPPTSEPNPQAQAKPEPKK